jgi:hypothetical protein
MKRIRAFGTDLFKLDIVLSLDGLSLNLLTAYKCIGIGLGLVEEENKDDQIIERLKDPEQVRGER